jgi:hypothetical protein
VPEQQLAAPSFTPATDAATAAVTTATAAASSSPETTEEQASACTQRGASELCGGLGLCGLNSPCPNVCCPADAECKHYSDFTWLCEQR